MGASTAVALAEVALPATLGRVVDQALATGASGPAPASGWAATGVGLVALRVVGEALADLAGGRASARVTGAHRRHLLRHAVDAGPGLTERFAPGELCSRVVGNAVEGGRTAVATAHLVATAVPAVGGAAALGLIDPRLVVTFLAGSLVAGRLVRAFFRTSTQVASRYLGAQAAISSRLVDALAGARTIAAARTVEHEVDRALAPLPELQGQGRAAWRTLARGAWQAATVGPAVQVAVLAVAGTLLADGQLSTGQVLAAGWYAAAGTGIGDAVAQLAQLARARAARARLAEVLATPVPAYGVEAAPEGPGTLELRAVTVDARGERLLDGLDLVVPAGCAVAVVGRSAAALGAVAAVAGRLRDPDAGDVLLDGVPLRRLSRRALRRAVTYGFGRPVLLGDTVADAVAFGADAPSGDAVRAAARAARADAFIERLAAGYDTPLDEAPMSGGEAQRVGLARAFAHAGRVVVLDDATSSLDTATELQVTAALTHRLADRARLVVAHRAATAAQADLVAWVEGGRVRAVAPHAELWADPAYRAVFAADRARQEA